jgi:hypothetical protein
MQENPPRCTCIIIFVYVIGAAFDMAFHERRLSVNAVGEK